MRTIAATVLTLASVPASGQTVTFDPASLTPMGNAVYFAGTQPTAGTELWRSDGSAPTLVRDIKPGAESSSPGSLVVIGGVLYLGANGSELWRSDGSSAGTRLVADLRDPILPPSTSYAVRPIAQVNQRILVAVSNLTTSCCMGIQLWATDPSGSVTERLGSFDGYGTYTIPFSSPVAHGALFFGAEGGLWRSDGTAAGTKLVKRFDSGFPYQLNQLTEVGGTLFFAANTGGLAGPDVELWRSDGTEAGTVRVKDINPGATASSLPSGLVALGNRLCFSAEDGSHGAELWTSDGTESGTFQVSDINPGAASSSPSSLAVMGETLYFRADDGVHGVELWRSDSTPTGTVLIKDINPGATSSAPTQPQPTPVRGLESLTAIGGWLYFAADDGTSGIEPWKSDGTEAGTVRVADVAAGTASSYPAGFSGAGGILLFSADDGVTGRDLWRFDPAGPTRVSTTTHAQPSYQSFFAVNTLETPMVGDFDGDGRTDIITFTRQNPLAIGDVYVALSEGTRFGPAVKWNDWFAITTDETVVIGDYDGDGKDDIATWLGTTSRQVYVARSLGTSMEAARVWVSSIGFDPSDVILAGDVNGDGKADLVCFARKQGQVYVALSTGTSFQAPTVWHNFFAVSTYERPRVADVNGDGKADIVTFATDSPTAFGDVYVALSDGTKFVDQGGVANSSTKWHDWFSIDPKQEIRIGDLNGDGKQDFFTFLPAPMAQCYTVRSQGTSMADNVLWPEAVAPVSTDVPFVGDVNGDGKADVIVFAQGEGKVYVSLGQ